ncbi:MAG: dUTP diphosphatase [Bacillota bacterium]
MNLQLLFKEQQLLRDKIAYNGPDRFEKLVLALLVELGECANEWRGFKFWSKDQEPRVQGNWKYQTGIIDGKFVNVYENPLLEEYVDKLHFILELGLELNCTDIELWPVYEKNITNQFIECSGRVYNLYFQMRVTGEVPKGMYEHLLAYFLGLGFMLDFTWEQIEQAYFEKNAINHQRQEDGY